MASAVPLDNHQVSQVLWGIGLGGCVLGLLMYPDKNCFTKGLIYITCQQAV